MADANKSSPQTVHFHDDVGEDGGGIGDVFNLSLPGPRFAIPANDALEQRHGVGREYIEEMLALLDGGELRRSDVPRNRSFARDPRASRGREGLARFHRGGG